MDEITLTLYNNKSAPNVVRKSFTQLTSMTGQLIENLNMENVVIHIPYFANYASCNYAYIPEFKRYYNVHVEVMNGGRLQLTMKSDPLTSFWDKYKISPCVAKRSTSNYNTQIEDGVIAFECQPELFRSHTTSKFNPSSSGGCYILTIGGK